MTDCEDEAQPPLPDVALLLFDIADAWRALQHGRTGLQPAVDPVHESQRLAAAWRALDEYSRRVFRGAKG